MADDRWQMADDKWQMTNAGWQMADGKCRMADDKPAVNSGGCVEDESSEPKSEDCGDLPPGRRYHRPTRPGLPARRVAMEKANASAASRRPRSAECPQRRSTKPNWIV